MKRFIKVLLNKFLVFLKLLELIRITKDHSFIEVLIIIIQSF
jgi:hypothetical protein